MSQWQVTPYAVPLVIAAALSATLAGLAWRRRSAPGVTPFVWLTLALAEWSLAYALELSSAGLQVALLLVKVEYVGIVIVPVATAVFALQYTGQRGWLTRRNLALAAIIPLVTLALVWTDDAHHLFYRSVRLDTDDSFPVLDFRYGPWFWVHAAYSYLLLLLSASLLFQALLESPRPYRYQATALLLGVLVPWLANALYISGLSALPRLDLTPFTFTLTGLVFAWGLFRFRLFDIMPVAQLAILEDMGDGVIVLDARDRVVYLNPAAGRAVECTVAEAIGRPAAQVFSRWADLVERYSGVAELHTEVILGEGDAQRYYDLRISPLYSYQGEQAGRLVVARNITRQKRAEEALRERNRELELLNRAGQVFISTLNMDRILLIVLDEVRRLLDVAASSVWLVDPRTEEVVCRQAAGPGADIVRGWRLPPGEGLAGWVIQNGESLYVPDARDDSRHFEGVNEQTGLGLRALFTVPLHAREGVIGALQVGDPQVDRFSPSDQTLVEALAATAAIAIENTRLFAEEERRAAELTRALEQQHELDRLKTEFIQNVSHELRTPLAIAHGYVEMLDSGGFGPLQPDQKESVAIIARRIRTLKQMLDDMAAILDAEAHIFKHELVDLGQVVAEAFVDFQATAKQAELTAAAEIDPDLPPVSGNLAHLRQVVDQLLSNAAKFTLPGGHVSVRLAQRERNLILAVTDTGIGIPADQLERIFDRFYQVDGSMSRRYKGVGLGLSLVKEIVEAHAGTVGVESTLGEGSTFTVVLPICEE